MSEFALSPKLLPAFRRLIRHYNSKGDTELRDLLEASRFHFEFGTEFDDWGDEKHGHDVLVFVPGAMIDFIDLDDENRISERILSDLNEVTQEVQNEYVRAVYLKLADELDPQYQRAVPLSHKHYAPPDDLHLWRDNSLRLFLSHRVRYKAQAHSLAEALEPYGVSVFVAHDKIEPTEDWQKEILNALMTMEVMLVLLTDDFHESNWTDQEIGFALGKGTPIICVKVGAGDPQGFIGARQALKGSLQEITDVAPEVYRTLINKIGQQARLKEILIEAFVSSDSYMDTMAALKRLTETTDHLTDSELKRIMEGYARNDQLHGCAGIHTGGNWFKRYLENATGKKLQFTQRRIIELQLSSRDDNKTAL